MANRFDKCIEKGPVWKNLHMYSSSDDESGSEITSPEQCISQHNKNTVSLYSIGVISQHTIRTIL